jgi:hypothetical protein
MCHCGVHRDDQVQLFNQRRRVGHVADRGLEIDHRRPNLGELRRSWIHLQRKEAHAMKSKQSLET